MRRVQGQQAPVPGARFPVRRCHRGADGWRRAQRVAAVALRQPLVQAQAGRHCDEEERVSWDFWTYFLDVPVSSTIPEAIWGGFDESRVALKIGPFDPGDLLLCLSNTKSEYYEPCNGRRHPAPPAHISRLLHRLPTAPPAAAAAKIKWPQTAPALLYLLMLTAEV